MTRGGRFAGRFAGGRFAGGRFAGGRFAGGRFAGGRFAGGRFAGARFAGGRFARASFGPRALLLALIALAAACSSARTRPAGPPAGDPLREVSAAELYRRGTGAAAAGDFVRAEQYLSSAIERGYPEERAMPQLLRVCLASSRLRAALRHAEPYLERHPAAWSLRYLVASIHLGIGDVDRARASLERVIADAPEQPDAHYLLGLLMRDEMGDRPAAARRFGRYLELAPGGEHAGEVRAALRALARHRREGRP